jgi:GTP-binding protein
MKVKKAEFSKFANHPSDFPSDGYPEIALVGRSNVGKSSLINTILGRKSLARTSNTPGKTRAVHFYLINDSFYLVDLPGYGYAKVSRQMQQEWAALLEKYLSGRSSLILIIQVVDLRHEPSRLDQQMADWIHHFSLPALLVATKADKIPRGKREKQRDMVAATLKADPQDTILFSAVTKEGRDELHRALIHVLSR